MIAAPAPWRPAATFDGVIDVSHFQGNINWPAVAAAGIVLTFIKATQGSASQDPMFVANRAAALAAGLMVVPYHFLDSSSVAKQVNNFRAGANLTPGIPVMVDWEQVPPSMIRAPMDLMRLFCGVIAEIIKRPPLAYHSMYDLASPAINAFPWMVPRYNIKPPTGMKYLFWQNRPDLTVPGIAVPVDHSIFSGTEAELCAWHTTGAMPAGFSVV